MKIRHSMWLSVGYDGSITDRETFDKASLNYRKMTLERIADRYAMKFMKLYEKELQPQTGAMAVGRRDPTGIVCRQTGESRRQCLQWRRLFIEVYR